MNSLVHSHIEIYFGPGIICLFKAQRANTDSEILFLFFKCVITSVSSFHLTYIYIYIAPNIREMFSFPSFIFPNRYSNRLQS